MAKQNNINKRIWLKFGTMLEVFADASAKTRYAKST